MKAAYIFALFGLFAISAQAWNHPDSSIVQNAGGSNDKAQANGGSLVNAPIDLNLGDITALGKNEKSSSTTQNAQINYDN